MGDEPLKEITGERPQEGKGKDEEERKREREREKEKGSVYAKGCWLTYEQVVIPALYLDVEHTFIFLVLFHCCVLRDPGRLT